MKEMAYIARDPCGCTTAVAIDIPGTTRAVAADIARWVRQGRHVERMSAARAVKLLAPCKHEEARDA